MQEQNRRAALGSMAGLWLTACGGGGSNEEAGVAAAGNTDHSGAVPSGAAAAPASVAPTAPAAAGQAPAPNLSFEQYLTWDAGDGPSRSHWSQHLQLPWKNPGVGDWIDSTGVPQGTRAYASFVVDTQQAWHSVDVTALVRKAVESEQNKGFMLRSALAEAVNFSGRLAATAPQLVIQTSRGEVTAPVRAFSSYSTTSASGVDSRRVVVLSRNAAAILQFQLGGVQDVTRATLRLYCEKKWTSSTTVSIFECDAPLIVVGASRAPDLGIAAQAGSEVALKSHPDVYRAGDFSDLTKGVVFDYVSLSDGTTTEQLPDPDAPGSVMLRGRFRPGTWDQGHLRGSCTFKVETMRADHNDPLRPPASVTEEMFARVYVFLEDDFDSVLDSNKMPMGWETRMGWWDDANKGYWQSLTGGGTRGDGRKRFAPAKAFGASQTGDRWAYYGHEIRMECGKASRTGNPYNDLRPVQDYVYHIDQATNYGDMFRLGTVCISKGRWFCFEQQIKMNSLTGPADQVGNREAVPDGVLRTWVDGVMCSEIINLRFRRHPQMGVQGPLLNWYYGGKSPSEVEMHYRMNHFACARRYIGPRVA